MDCYKEIYANRSLLAKDFRLKGIAKLLKGLESFVKAHPDWEITNGKLAALDESWKLVFGQVGLFGSGSFMDKYNAKFGRLDLMDRILQEVKIDLPERKISSDPKRDFEALVDASFEDKELSKAVKKYCSSKSVKLFRSQIRKIPDSWAAPLEIKLDKIQSLYDLINASGTARVVKSYDLVKQARSTIGDLKRKRSVSVVEAPAEVAVAEVEKPESAKTEASEPLDDGDETHSESPDLSQ